MPPKGNQGSPDGILDFRSAGLGHLTFRLGVQFRDPLRPPPPPGSILTNRYVRVQVASPPPGRIDGTTWEKGLRDSSGAPFTPGSRPADGEVTPLKGIAPLGQPDPRTIVFDRWLAVPVVSPTRALTRTFAFESTDTADAAEPPLSFLSTFYPRLRIDGTLVTVAGVAYYTEGRLDFDRPVDTAADGDYVAVSLERFFPAERPSADYIVRVTPDVARKVDSPHVVEAPVAPAWSVDPPTDAPTDATA